MDAGFVERDALELGEGVVGVEPALDRLAEEWADLRIALEGSAVEREEEALEVGLGGIGEELPHVPDHTIGASRPSAAATADDGELLPGPGLHGAHDFDQEAALGAEVVQEHAMAGPDGGGDLAQAHVTEAVDDEVVHHLIDELLLGGPARMFQMVHSLRRHVDSSRGSEASWDCR